ncbi:MAG: exo-alpha-sialidase, partial [Defluviitaleaceae bacterium]|nr:exo-alpha-sialidase [Defluviitaleaceae bacterium]
YASTDWMKKGMLMQTESYDDGRTWTAQHPTDMPSLSTPAHLIKLADGRLMATHSSRQYPNSVYVTVSNDEGVTWQTRSTKTVCQDLVNFDSTYPTSVQFADGTLFTVWYGNRFGKFYIGYARYGPESLQ